MEIVDSVVIEAGALERRIDLCQGDLTSLPPEFAVDVLVVSAFPGVYFPVAGTLIGALSDVGVSVEALAADIAIDLRASCSCWLSKPIQDPTERGFRQILCFEPQRRGDPPQVVGDIFRSLIPFLEGPNAVRTVAMPLVATGEMGTSAATMLPPLLDAAFKWMTVGLSLDRLIVAVYGERDLAEARDAFALAKERLATPDVPHPNRFSHDVFLSYARADADDADLVESLLTSQRPDLRIFRDTRELTPGVAWQQRIFEAVDDCHRVLALYSPAYLRSDICKEEVNLALYRARVAGENPLFPIYMRTTELPSYLGITDYVDCREAARDKIRGACSQLIAGLPA